MVLVDHGQLQLSLRLLSAIVLDAAMSTDFTRLASPGTGVRAYERLDVHEVLNPSDAVATSVHAYSPPLRHMRHYDLDGSARLRVVHNEIVTVADDKRL